MKRIAIFSIILFVSVSCFAERPQWTFQTPKATNDSYYYNVESGEGSTQVEAYNNAWAKMFSTMTKFRGLPINAQEINRSLQLGTSYEVLSQEYNIPMHKSCEWTETKQINGVTTYVVWLLCQIANDGFGTHQFDEFTECTKMPKNPYIGYAFVPGMAQIKKGSTAKGVCFITGEVVFVGGIVVSECLRQSYINKIGSTKNSQLRMQYTKNANACGIARNISIAGVAAVYVWNVIDGIVAKAPVVAWNDTQLKFAPYADFESAGLAVNVQF